MDGAKAEAATSAAIAVNGDARADADAGSGGTLPLQRARGRLELTVKAVDGRTRLADLHQAGCLKLRFPKVAGALSEAVVINTSGGLTGGDRLQQRFAAGPGAELSLTTQACERIYRASAGRAEVSTDLKIGAGGFLAWLPQETILFDEGALRRRLDVEAADDARFVLCESVILGREMMGESVLRGNFHESWRVRCGGQLVFADETRLDGAIATAAKAGASLGGNRAFATLVARLDAPESALGAIRAILGDSGGASVVDGLVVARLVAPSGFLLRRRLIPAIAALAQGAVPRLWSL
ncbi:urease accessory protein UreD [Jiella sp. MQZ9-1]|uniref:Urease accessory protein UreD n=1 Tax=Jiella flava TaxID=2816857 RepID=A0A939JUL4_9HYPH|nr:urease accessory protein UreD [Jiella flava]MBO0661072.1 urease accessory protein UreD [Jiella flava]MCD2469719.1 urease accessory protein UreD [Jiella flava]